MSDPRSPRLEDSVDRDYANLVNSYALNENARDSFLAVAHTALFAASIAFVGNVVHFDNARLRPLLILAWLAGVIGLLSLTLSFQVAQRSLKRQIERVRNPEDHREKLGDWLNIIALWSFPLSLIALFFFLATNVTQPVTKLPEKYAKLVPDSEGVQAGVMAAPRLPEVMENKSQRSDGKKGVTAAPRAPEKTDQQPAPAPADTPTTAPAKDGKD